jgi:secreted protein with Ig-like and vWFA domain
MGPLSDQIDGRPRSAALTAKLDSQTPSAGGAVSFTTLRLVYDQAKTNFRQGQENSVLLITAGPHSDQTLGGDGLQAYIRGAFDPTRPIAVNVIDFGSGSDRGTWEAVAQATGGTYKNLGSSASPDLTAAIAEMMA